MSVRERGDTIVEVLFAFAVFSLVAVGAMTVMGQGVNAAQNALEITLVRQQIDAQAEALRYMNAGYIASHGVQGSPSPAAAEWQKVASRSVTDATQVAAFGSGTTTLCPAVPSGSYIIDAPTARVAGFAPQSVSVRSSSSPMPPPYAKVTYDSRGQATAADGIWIQSVRRAPGTGDAGAGYIDFHINACWERPGAGRASTIGTIVRLYEPR